MDLNEIRELIRLMRENHLAEIDLEQEGRKVRLVSARESAPAPMYAPPIYMHGPAPGGHGPAQLPAPGSSGASEAPEEPADPYPNAVVIPSPLVGTFYRSPSPDAPPFVREGDDVHDDSTLCIVEAMKVMNEIKAETKGRIVEILVENGHPVEFGQPLFRVVP